MHDYYTQGRSQEFQKGVSINGRMSIKHAGISGGVVPDVDKSYTCTL